MYVNALNKLFVIVIANAIILIVGAGQNRPRTESPRHNRPNKVGDYVLFTDDYIQPCYMFSAISMCYYE